MRESTPHKAQIFSKEHSWLVKNPSASGGGGTAGTVGFSCPPMAAVV
jgi:hypothetical protein